MKRHEFLELKPKLLEPQHPPCVPQTIQTGLALRQACFQYADRPRQALQDTNLTLHPDEVVVLVGENGCGKATLLKLLCHLYDPTSGSITLDETDLHHLPMVKLHQASSVIFQDCNQSCLSAQENIWLGNINTVERVSP